MNKQSRAACNRRGENTARNTSCQTVGSDRAGFSDPMFRYVLSQIEWRSKEEVDEDIEWAREITQAIINRRKDRTTDVNSE